MEKYKLSELIFDACDRIHEATTDLYERLHPEGNPRFKHDVMVGRVIYKKI